MRSMFHVLMLLDSVIQGVSYIVQDENCSEVYQFSCPKKQALLLSIHMIRLDSLSLLSLNIHALSKNPGIAVVNASGRTNLALSMALKLKSIGIPIDETQIKNQKEKVEKTFIRFNSSIIKPDNIVLSALTL
jgi:hypothetical protein